MSNHLSHSSLISIYHLWWSFFIISFSGNLPKLAPLIHDSSERVRSALIDLLLYVKHIRNFHFFDIVPLDHLLFRLGLDINLLFQLLKITILIQQTILFLLHWSLPSYWWEPISLMKKEAKKFCTDVSFSSPPMKSNYSQFALFFYWCILSGLHIGFIHWCHNLHHFLKFASSLKGCGSLS